MVLSLIGSVVGGYLAAQGAKKASKATAAANAQQLAYLKSIYPRFQQATAGDFGQQVGYLQSIIPQISSGYDEARKAASEIGYSSRRSALDREKQQLGAAQTGAVRSGLSGTTSLDAIRRGVTSDTNRAIADINELVAGIHTNLITGKTNALAQAQGNLANAYGNRANQGLSAMLGSASGVGNIQHSAGVTPDYSYLGAIGGQLDSILKKNSGPTSFSNS